MGWQIDGQSEGWVVGLVAEPGAGTWDAWLRELGPRQGDDKPRRDLAAVQAGCSCGWRGPRRKVYDFMQVEWQPYCVFFGGSTPDVLYDAERPPTLSQALLDEWCLHYATCPLRGALGASVAEMVATFEAAVLGAEREGR